MNKTSDRKIRLASSQHERLAREYAERVYNTLVALEPLYEVHQGIEWLITRQGLLHNNCPAALLSLHSGTEKIEQVLAQILDGAFV